MNEVLELRSKLAITQSKFAELIGVSRSIIAMVETGERSLPDHAWVKLGQLQRKIENQVPEEQELEGQSQEVLENYLLQVVARRDRYIQLLAKAEKKIRRMRNARAGALETIRVVNDELALFHGVPSITSNLESRLNEANELLAKLEPGKQRLLELRVKELAALIPVMNAEITNLDNPQN